uniref:Zgc:154093 n=1 Tax=Tetraodon nigroviridis TaxID=99883 RepID=H3C2P4_TETNG
MPAKTPMYLKTTTPKKGKKLKLRDILSGDMISPPLGDVRHSAHVGPEGEGDMFGDVGFLQGKMNMLPSNTRTHNGRTQSVDGRTDDSLATKPDYNGYQYQHSPAGLLKTTISLPVFIAHEQAPPKPPRLHLGDPSPPRQNPLQQHAEDAAEAPLASEPCRDMSLSPTIRKLVPSSGSFSEVSSEDSMYEACGPLDVHRGLSLDSDAGLSNEDLMSEGSQSPCGPSQPARVTASSAGVPRSDSLAGLNLDLGPSILEDVLSIMDRYKAHDNRCEL